MIIICLLIVKHILARLSPGANVQTHNFFKVECRLRGVGLRKFDLVKISLITREIREIFIIMKFFASKLSNIRSIAKTAPSFWLVLTYVAREHGSRWFSSKAPEKHQHFFSVVAWHCEENFFLFLLIHCTCPLFG